MAFNLHEQHYSAVTRQNGLVMAATGSAIAFSFHHSADWEWSLPYWLLGLAIVAWGIGFYLGIINGHAKQAAIQSNIAMNKFEELGDQAHFDIAKKQFQEANKKAQDTYSWQLKLLLAGAIIFAIASALEKLEVGRDSDATADQIHCSNCAGPLEVQEETFAGS